MIGKIDEDNNLSELLKDSESSIVPLMKVMYERCGIKEATLAKFFGVSYKEIKSLSTSWECPDYEKLTPDDIFESTNDELRKFIRKIDLKSLLIALISQDKLLLDTAKPNSSIEKTLINLERLVSITSKLSSQLTQDNSNIVNNVILSQNGNINIDGASVSELAESYRKMINK